jgi:hypothetical protein
MILSSCVQCRRSVSDLACPPNYKPCVFVRLTSYDWQTTSHTIGSFLCDDVSLALVNASKLDMVTKCAKTDVLIKSFRSPIANQNRISNDVGPGDDRVNGCCYDTKIINDRHKYLLVFYREFPKLAFNLKVYPYTDSIHYDLTNFHFQTEANDIMSAQAEANIAATNITISYECPDK